MIRMLTKSLAALASGCLVAFLLIHAVVSLSQSRRVFLWNGNSKEKTEDGAPAKRIEVISSLSDQQTPINWNSPWFWLYDLDVDSVQCTNPNTEERERFTSCAVAVD
jgi:hypothetical protein